MKEPKRITRYNCKSYKSYLLDATLYFLYGAFVLCIILLTIATLWELF